MPGTLLAALLLPSLPLAASVLSGRPAPSKPIVAPRAATALETAGPEAPDLERRRAATIDGERGAARREREFAAAGPPTQRHIGDLL